MTGCFETDALDIKLKYSSLPLSPRDNSCGKATIDIYSSVPKLSEFLTIETHDRLVYNTGRATDHSLPELKSEVRLGDPDREAGV